VPLLLAAAVYAIMWIWHTGISAVHQRFQETFTPLEPFLAMLQTSAVPRVPGAAVFFTRAAKGAPPVLVWHVKHNRALHEFVLVLRLTVASTPASRRKIA